MLITSVKIILFLDLVSVFRRAMQTRERPKEDYTSGPSSSSPPANLMDTTYSDNQSECPTPSGQLSQRGNRFSDEQRTSNQNRSQLFPCLTPCNQHMRNESSRLQTFHERRHVWPGRGIAATPEEMAQAGLYYIGMRCFTHVYEPNHKYSECI